MKRFLPRLRGSRASECASRAHPALDASAAALREQDAHLALNRLFLSGVIVADPQHDYDRDGEPVSLLLVAFAAPDALNRTPSEIEVASCEVEVPERIARKHRDSLRAGRAVMLSGQISGGGGVIATQIHSGGRSSAKVDGAPGPPRLDGHS